MKLLKDMLTYIQYEGLDIEIKRAVSFTDKNDIANNVAERILEDGEKFRNVMLVPLILKSYTNVEVIMENDLIDANETYDVAVRSGLWNEIKTYIYNGEIEEINYLIDLKIKEHNELLNTIQKETERTQFVNDITSILNDKFKEEDKIENQLKRFIESIPNNAEVKKLLKELPKVVNKFDQDKLDTLRNIGKEVGINIPTKENLDNSKQIAESVLTEMGVK